MADAPKEIPPDGYMVKTRSGVWIDLTGKYLDEALSRNSPNLRPYWLHPHEVKK